MNTATTTFVLSTKGSDISQGVTVAVTDLPHKLRWWLTAGSLTRWATRRRGRTDSPAHPEPVEVLPRI